MEMEEWNLFRFCAKIDYEPSWQEGQPLLEMIEKREFSRETCNWLSVNHMDLSFCWDRCRWPFFVTFNRHILMIKKIRLLNRKSLSDTVKPCTIIWSNGINCHFFSKTLDNLDSVEVAVVEPVPLRGVTFLIQRQPLLPKVGIYSIDIGRFDGWKDFCGCTSL